MVLPPVLCCIECGELWFIDKHGGSEHPMCIFCGSMNLECDHAGRHFDRERQCFVCNYCGEEDHDGAQKLRKLAKDRPRLGLQKVLDITDH